MFLLQQIRVIKFQVGLVIVEIRKGGVGILAVCIVSGCKKMSPILKDNSEKIFSRRKIDKDIVAPETLLCLLRYFVVFLRNKGTYDEIAVRGLTARKLTVKNCQRMEWLHDGKSSLTWL